MHYICSDYEINRRLTRRITILLLFVGLLSSCFDDGDCQSTKTDLLLIDFKSFNTKADSTVTIQSIILQTYQDSLFHKGESISSAILPLDPNVDTLQVIFNYADTSLNMVLSYTTTPRLITPDCGVELGFGNIEVVEHDFDSVVVKSGTLDQQITSNIVIYQ